MHCSASGAVDRHLRFTSTGCNPAKPVRTARALRAQRAQNLDSFRSCVWDARRHSEETRHTRTAAGLVLPDPSTGTCLIHNICHAASAVIIVLATVRNVPQILKCWRSRSALGLSAAGLATEVTCYACTVAYGVRRGYAMTLWGSELACWLQDMALLGLVARLRGITLPTLSLVAVGWLALKSVLFTETVPLWFLSQLQIFVGLILGLGARVPQILLSFKNGHTGNLALPTYIFNSTANLVCCTSTAIITGDIYVMLKEIWMFSLNATIVSQILRTNARRRAGELPEDLSTVPEPVPARVPGVVQEKPELAVTTVGGAPPVVKVKPVEIQPAYLMASGSTYDSAGESAPVKDTIVFRSRSRQPAVRVAEAPISGFSSGYGTGTRFTGRSFSPSSGNGNDRGSGGGSDPWEVLAGAAPRAAAAPQAAVRSGGARRNPPIRHPLGRTPVSAVVRPGGRTRTPPPTPGFLPVNSLRPLDKFSSVPLTPLRRGSGSTNSLPTSLDPSVKFGFDDHCIQQCYDSSDPRIEFNENQPLPHTHESQARARSSADELAHAVRERVHQLAV